MFFTSYLLAHNRYIVICGIAVVLFLAWCFSAKRRAVSFSTVLRGLLVQLALAFFVLKTTVGRLVVGRCADAAGMVYAWGAEGARFIFGNLTDASGPWGFVFGINVLPVIIFFGALTSVLFYCGIIQSLVRLVNFFVQPSLGTPGP